jgi:UDP-N-acetylglucosamine transferase subunit ALG13
MILVAVGSSQFPFDRLLRAVEDFPRGEPIIVQHGASAIRPSGASCWPFIPLETIARLTQEARVVVTHAGVGSILLALANGKKPFVVARRRAFGETVDDHQVESARRFATIGVVNLVEEPEQLAAAMAAEGSNTVEFSTPSSTDSLPLVTELRDYLSGVVGGPAAAMTP